MSYQHILVERDDSVATITMNRPERRNALSEAHMGELIAALRGLGGEPAVRAVILAANGPAFCAGHDLKEMRATPSLDYYQRLFAQCSKMMLAAQRLPETPGPDHRQHRAADPARRR